MNKSITFALQMRTEAAKRNEQHYEQKQTRKITGQQRQELKQQEKTT